LVEAPEGERGLGGERLELFGEGDALAHVAQEDAVFDRRTLHRGGELQAGGTGGEQRSSHAEGERPAHRSELLSLRGERVGPGGVDGFVVVFLYGFALRSVALGFSQALGEFFLEDLDAIM
jgi:hypothetical protein